MLNLAATTPTGHVVEPLFVDEPDERIFHEAITTREPDHELPRQELAWWLGVQERIELRAELAESDLL
jgi:hypothetical protein